MMIWIRSWKIPSKERKFKAICMSELVLEAK
jgi:hypothetical protein